MIMAQRGSSKANFQERRSSSSEWSGGGGENCESGPLETVVILKLGSIPKSTAEDIKKWIESFGAVESEEVESEKLTVTGKVDAKRMREMFRSRKAKAKAKNKINGEKGPKEAGGLGKEPKDDGQNEKSKGNILKKEVEKDDDPNIQPKEEGKSGKDDDLQKKKSNGKTHGEDDPDLDTVVVLNLGLNPKNFGADIQKWIRRFGAVESEHCKSGKLTVTGKVDAKRLGVMLSMMASNQAAGSTTIFGFLYDIFRS